MADFDVHHRRLATDPESSFVKTLVVQSPRPDRIVTVRSRTLSAVGPDGRHQARARARGVRADCCATEFGLTVGGERLERLWTRAVAQHEAFLARA